MAAPIFSSSAVAQLGPDFVDVTFQLDQDARVYGIAQDAAQVAPDAAEIKAGLSGDGVTPAESTADTVGFVNGGGAYSFRLEGLNADDTDIDVYLVATNAGSEDSLIEATVTALTIPSISDPGPNGSFDPGATPTPPQPAFGTTLPDAIVASGAKTWFDLLAFKPYLEYTGDNQLTLNFEVSSVAGLTTPTYTIKKFAAGSKPPTDAEAIDTPDVAATALTVGAKAVVVPGTADETAYDVYLTFDSTETGQWTVHVGREGSTLGNDDAPYISWGTGVGEPSMPAGIVWSTL